MKRKLLALALTAVMVSGLAACGGSTASTASGGNTDSKAAESAAEGGEAASGWTPSGTVSIILPAGAGGDTDITARTFAQYAKEISGVDFIVVNASGASGSVAANQVLQSANDGLTCLYGHTLVNVANIAGITDYNYTAFTLGPTFAKNPAQGLYVKADKYEDLNAFIEAAKAAPGQLKAATEVGAYTYYELLAFEKAAGIDLDLVDVGSNSDKITAMLSGQIDLMPGAYLSCKDYIASGDFRCIGAPTAEAYEITPDVPVLKEEGIDLVYPDCDYSFYFPADTDPAIIAWYDDIVAKVLENEAAVAALNELPVMAYYLTSEESAVNEETMFNTISEIAASLK
ncbi:MAG: tripartite tricarboxylate transporter substrate binding protein [Lachnospiraceae bacterium]|nr:tripartite tricarboxylate transporter substrate binding protein [Lachnospiraceae bacterium]